MHKAVTKKCFRFTSCLQQEHKERACHAKTESICARAAVWRLFTMPTPCISMVRFEYMCKRPGASWTAANLTQNRRKTNKQIHQQAVRQTAKQTAKRAHKTIRNTCARIVNDTKCIKPENDKNTITRLNLEPGWFTRFSCWCNHHNLLKLESSAKQLASSLITQSDALRRCHLRLPRARPLSWTSIVRQSAASTARHYKRYSDAKQCARFLMNPNDV